jgi:MbtH protein
MSFDREETVFRVVVNHEQQYSIWPDYKSVPPGWAENGITGLKSECLTWIETYWTDLRPLSLRKALEIAPGN